MELERERKEKIALINQQVELEIERKEKEIALRNKQAELERESKKKEIDITDKQAELEREREDKEAAKKRNSALSEANKKAERRIRNGTVVLVLTLFFAGILGIFAAREGERVIQANIKASQAEKQLEETLKQITNAKQIIDIKQKKEAEEIKRIAEEKRRISQDTILFGLPSLMMVLYIISRLVDIKSND